MTSKDIKQFLAETVLPETIRLDQATLITDVPKFFETTIIVLEGNSYMKFKMLHYNRAVKAMEIIKNGEPMKKPEEVKEVKEVKIDSDPIIKDTSTSSVHRIEAIVPNEGVSATMKPNTSFDNDAPAVVPHREPEPEPLPIKGEPNRIIETKPKEKKKPIENNQGSLF